MTYTIQRYIAVTDAWMRDYTGSGPYVRGYVEGAASLPPEWHRYPMRIVDNSGAVVEAKSIRIPAGAYVAEIDRDGEWARLAAGSRDYCRGWYDAHEGYRPRPALRILRDGVAVEESEARGPVRLA